MRDWQRQGLSLMILTYKIKSKLLSKQCLSGFGPVHPSCQQLSP